MMPNAVLDRGQFAGFRTGSTRIPTSLRVAFGTPWDLRRMRPHFFPRGSAVLSGTRASDRVGPMPATAEVFTGRLDRATTSWRAAAEQLSHHLERIGSVEEKVKSIYKDRFRQGASVVPRVLFLVEAMPPGPLGLKSGTIAVRSVRSANEKLPWKELDSLEGVVESEFVYPMYLGEHVLPYRTLPATKALIPWAAGMLMDSEHSRLELYPGLTKWWRNAEATWRKHRSSDRLSLTGQLDFHRKLTSQYPSPNPAGLFIPSRGCILSLPA